MRIHNPQSGADIDNAGIVLKVGDTIEVSELVGNQMLKQFGFLVSLPEIVEEEIVIEEVKKEEKKEEKKNIVVKKEKKVDNKIKKFVKKVSKKK